MRSRLIIALFLLIGLLFPMLPERGGQLFAQTIKGYFSNKKPPLFNIYYEPENTYSPFGK